MSSVGNYYRVFHYLSKWKDFEFISWILHCDGLFCLKCCIVDGRFYRSKRWNTSSSPQILQSLVYNMNITKGILEVLKGLYLTVYIY